MPKTPPGRHRTVLASLAVIALALATGGFFLGARMRAAAESRPAASASSRAFIEATARPTSSPARSLPAEDPGTRAWDALTGGECLRAFASPWEPRYDVIACRAAYAAQLTRVVALPGGA